MSFEAYSKYLLSDYISARTGRPLGDGPRNDYPSRLRSLERLLETSIEGAQSDKLKKLAPALRRDPKLASTSPKVIAGMATALRSYVGFLETRSVTAIPSQSAA